MFMCLCTHVPNNIGFGFFADNHNRHFKILVTRVDETFPPWIIIIQFRELTNQEMGDFLSMLQEK